MGQATLHGVGTPGLDPSPKFCADLEFHTAEFSGLGENSTEDTTEDSANFREAAPERESAGP